MDVQGTAAAHATTGKRLEDAAVRAQLECLIGSAPFRNSKRYTSLLRHLVERTLEGREAELKERRLGVEVFRRPVDYDPNSDPIVRTSAGELRRRIAQYYHEARSESEIRIDLPVGSYVPEFHTSPRTLTALEPVAPFPVRESRNITSIWGVVAAMVLALAALGAWWIWDRPTDLVRFWRPVLQSKTNVSLCVALSGLASDSTTSADRSNRPQIVALPDVKAITRLVAFLSSNKQPFRLQVDDRTTMDELRTDPAVLVGAFNDIWTIRVMADLRFRFRHEGSSWWVEDQQNPTSRAWALDLSSTDAAGRPQIKRDYAVISRILTAKTGQPVVAVAGIRGFGTEIAGECVTNPGFMAEIVKQAPREWEKMNAQIVISTDVIDGHPGPATILSTYFWR
jgi:hypothetical protein